MQNHLVTHGNFNTLAQLQHICKNISFELSTHMRMHQCIQSQPENAQMYIQMYIMYLMCLVYNVYHL